MLVRVRDKSGLTFSSISGADVHKEGVDIGKCTP